MKKVLCKVLSFLKYILLIVSFGLVFYCLLTTYSRLEKPITDGINVLLPFGLVLICFLVSLISRAKYVSKSLLFNFVAVFIFVTSIIVCLRAMYDTNMFLYFKYEINFNPSYFSDNLSFILMELYMLFAANVILLIASFVDKDKKKVVRKEEKTNDDLKKKKVYNITDDDDYGDEEGE